MVPACGSGAGLAALQLAEQPIDGGDVLEPFGFQADGGGPGRGAGQQPIAVQLEGVAGHPQCVGLAGPRPANHHLDAGAALADVPDHRPLLGPQGRIGRQRSADGVVANHRGLLA
jgi:hypothetical protein